MARGTQQQPGNASPLAETDVAAFCRRLLASETLEQKLAPAPPELPDPEGAAPEIVAAPRRGPGLEMAAGAAPLPRPGELGDPRKRARCLARFAHHELMAAELFAFALLCWPTMERGLRQGLLRALGDEQRHARLYLERLEAHGSRLADHAPHSGYFWKHAQAMAAGGPASFLAGMGLTLEQANLDFAPVYRDAFRAAGDEASARVCEVVHADEVRHVRLAAEGLRALHPELDDVARYEASVPFPLSAARAKGRAFDAAARRSAGLEPAFIEHVRTARSSAERGRR